MLIRGLPSLSNSQKGVAERVSREHVTRFNTTALPRSMIPPLAIARKPFDIASGRPIRGAIAAMFLFAMMPFGRADLLYFNDFGTTLISGSTYTGSPTLATGISSAVWTTSVGSFVSFTGITAGGAALSLSNSSGTPTMTLTLTLDNNYTLDLESFSFWTRRSLDGAQNWTLSVLSTQVGSGSSTTSFTSTGTVTPSTSEFGGSEGRTNYTFILGLSGASGTGTFRLDDFTLNGTLTLAAGAPAVPEPGTWAAATLLTAAAWLRWRRRAQTS